MKCNDARQHHNAPRIECGSATPVVFPLDSRRPLLAVTLAAQLTQDGRSAADCLRAPAAVLGSPTVTGALARSAEILADENVMALQLVASRTMLCSRPNSVRRCHGVWMRSGDVALRDN